MSDARERPPNLLSRRFAIVAGHAAGITGHPLAFVFSIGGIAVWLIASVAFHVPDAWQALINTVVTITTFLMVFLLQSSQNRDAIAVQAKLDELIRALEPANNQFIGMEMRTIQEVHELRQETIDEVQKLEELIVKAAGEDALPQAGT